MKLVNICPEAVQSGLVQTLPACQINIVTAISLCSGLLQLLTDWCCSTMDRF